jgi:hypothetical protein
VTNLTVEAIRLLWELRAWEVRVGETIFRPLGDRPQGVIYYADDGWMAVQITGPDVRAQARISRLTSPRG